MPDASLARRTAPLAAVIALVVLVGCAQPAEPAVSSAPPSASSEPGGDAAPSPTPEGIDTSDWLTYATHDGDMTYRYPADWTLESEAQFFSPDADRDDVEDPYARYMDAAVLTAPNGQALLHSYDFVDLGGACGGPETFQPVELLATEPLAASADTTIVTAALRSVDGRWTFGMGLVSGDVSTIDTCVVQFTTGSSDGGLFLGTSPTIASNGDDPLWTVDTLDDARAYMETEEYATILEILRSVRLS
jgi:hypothetical protein